MGEIESALRNALTLEQFKAEISESEARLSQALQERQRESDAEFQALAEEREFQFNLVRDQLSANIEQVERARVLLFLAKSGILSQLDVDYLEGLAKEQLKTDEVVIPHLAPSASPESSMIFEKMNLGLWKAGDATVRLPIRGGDGEVRICSGFFVSSTRVAVADYCLRDLEDVGVREGLVRPSDSLPVGSFSVTDFEIFPSLGLGIVTTSAPTDSILEVAEHDELSVGMPVVIIHYPAGPFARVSKCKHNEARWPRDPT